MVTARWLFAMAATLQALPATAQPRGTVRDPSGHPIPNASVLLWAGTEDVASTSTNGQGRFTIDLTSLTPANMLVRAVGYRPQSFQVTTWDRPVDVTLEAVPQLLPEVRATAAEFRCPREEPASARALWQGLTTRYAPEPADVGVRSGMFWLKETGSLDDALTLSEDRLRAKGCCWAAIEGNTRNRGYRFIEDSAYARRLVEGSGSLGDTDFFSWWYPSLHRWHADYFVRPEFGQRQHFDGYQAEGGLLVLTFCSIERAGTRLEGYLLILPDTTLLEAHWRFRTPKPVEDAGGVASFLPPQSGRLRPAQGLFWRRVGGNDNLYYRDAAIYNFWKYSPDSRMP